MCPWATSSFSDVPLGKAFGVILLACGAFALSLLVLDPDSTSGGSTILGIVLLVVGAGLFFLPGRGSRAG